MFANPMVLAAVAVIAGVLVSGVMAVLASRRPITNRRGRALVGYAAVMCLVIAVMVVANSDAGLGRGISMTLEGVHGEGVLAWVGLAAGAAIVALTPTTGGSPPPSR